ncbi:OmpA family protein [bacterium]|nr:OmpA family protein [bacterium]
MNSGMQRRILCLCCALLLLTGCSSTSFGAREKGALGGTAVGAGLGAIIGSASGDAGVGTAIGAGIGALSGALIGNEVQKEEDRRNAQDARLDENQRLIEENERLLQELRRQGQDARLTDRGVVVNIPDVLFAFDRFGLTPEAKSTIREIAQTVREEGDDAEQGSSFSISGRAISIEGHTDSVGTMSYNQDLSLRRARSVAKALESEGISRSRLFVRAFGEGDPIASNSTEAGRARNRRVEIIVENPAVR